ncbi:MAG: putative salt-induced outer membrane protein YdiY [Planctomycetota bacterium]|jgi:putative salt-induced outer membrane protein YdiY
MRNLLSIAAMAALSVGALAQDKITLSNSDVITGKITSMADGKVTIKSPLLGEVIVPIANVSDLVTGESVTLKTKTGDVWQRRITGIESGSLRLEGGATSSLSLDNLGMINPPTHVDPSWTGSLNFTGVNTTGNTETRQAGLAFDASLRSPTDRITVDAAWSYGENKDRTSPSASSSGYVLTQRRVGGGLKYDYYLSDKSYLLATTRVLGDTIANLELRYTVGSGLGYTLIDDGKDLFLFEVGLSYFNESYRVVAAPNPTSTDYLAARVAYRYEHPLSDATKLVHRAEAFPSLENKKDIYCQVTTELQTKLTQSMVATVTHVFDYDNTPAVGFKRGDHRVVLSVGWAF